jgi:hypothetical protein
VPLILFIVCGDFRLTLLINFDLEPTFTRPLLPQILIKLFNGFVGELLDFLGCLLLIQLLLGHDPRETRHESILQDFYDLVNRDLQAALHGWITLWVAWWLHLCLLKEIIWLERWSLIDCRLSFRLAIRSRRLWRLLNQCNWCS